MARIVAEINEIIKLAEEITPVLQSYTTNRQTILYDDFSQHDIHKVLVLKESIRSITSLPEITNVLQTSIHAHGIRGLITRSFEKMGFKGVASDFHSALIDFNKAFLAGENIRPELLPKGFRVAASREIDLSVLKGDEVRKERKQAVDLLAEQRKRQPSKGMAR